MSQLQLLRRMGNMNFFLILMLNGIDKITLIALDDYDNEKILTYSLIRTEINPPKIHVLAPYASDDGRIYLDNNSPTSFPPGENN